MGQHNIVPNYFEQNQAEALDLNTTVLDTLVQAAPDAKINDLKQLLGRMLFSGNAMEKKVRSCRHTKCNSRPHSCCTLYRQGAVPS
jgi:ATPase subunit of ABC transporter with duplicated ATPase domains